MTGPVLNLIDRALFAETARPLAASLVAVLVALLTERLLRLFRLVTGGGGPLDLVGLMALNLVPHYLGLALPAALFLAVALVIGRLSSDSEVDALRGAGVSVRRASRPFLLWGLVLAGVNLGVVGWLQPLGRYEYRALAHLVTQEVWDMRLPPRTVVRLAEGVEIAADRADGRRLAGVFLRQRAEDGTITVTTARSGVLVIDEDGRHARLQLSDGVLLRRQPGKEGRTLAFNSLRDVVTVRIAADPFRARGDEERELTLPELARAISAGHPLIPRAHLRSEFNARLARVVSLPLIPMLAVGAGLGAKRGRRGLGLVGGGLVLFLFHHLLLTGEGLANNGAPAALAIWGPPGGLLVLASGLFLRLDRRPG